MKLSKTFKISMDELVELDLKRIDCVWRIPKKVSIEISFPGEKKRPKNEQDSPTYFDTAVLGGH